MAARYTVLGVNDECTTCDCCGRRDLKRTVVMEHAGDGHISRMGVGCAAEALRISPARVKKLAVAKQSEAEIRAAEISRKQVRLAQLLVLRADGAVITEAGQNIFEVIRVLTSSLEAA
jgi:hypothetical protein